MMTELEFVHFVKMINALEPLINSIPLAAFCIQGHETLRRWREPNDYTFVDRCLKSGLTYENAQNAYVLAAALDHSVRGACPDKDYIYRLADILVPRLTFSSLVLTQEERDV